MIVLMAGLPGTGKTTLARELALRTRGALVGKDELRAAIFSPEDIEYTVKQDDFVMELMLDAARYMLERDGKRNVFLDGRPFSRSYQIERVLQFAREIGQPWLIIECKCSDESAQQRLESDRSHAAVNRSFALYLEVKARFESITYAETAIDTDQPLERCIEQGMTALRAIRVSG